MRVKFEEFGDVLDVVLIRERKFGRSWDTGFVMYAYPAGADLAIQQMHNVEFDGQIIAVTSWPGGADLSTTVTYYDRILNVA